MEKLIGFTTYPTRYPIHGGQRRIHAFAEFYNEIGFDYESVCIYEKENYSRGQVGSHDRPLERLAVEFSDVPFVSDLLSGRYGAEASAAIDHFSRLLIATKPRAITLEQPFMWPLVKRLRENREINAIPVVYSSQNWEPPLKYEMLIRSGVNREVAGKVRTQIEELERELVDACAVIFAVSDADAKIYRALSPDKPLIVVRNGVNRALSSSHGKAVKIRNLQRNRFFFFVGSAYPPNIEGICDLLLEGGLFFVPPLKSFALCGGAAEGIFRHTKYQQFLDANSARVDFFQNVRDEDLDALKEVAHAILLPINFGGGSNLKTAEALASRKWVIATPTALRGYEQFSKEPGITIANGQKDFRRAVMEIYQRPPLELSRDESLRRESVYWDRCFDELRQRDFRSLLKL